MEMLTKRNLIISASLCCILSFWVTLVVGSLRDSRFLIVSCKYRQKVGLVTTFTMVVSVLSLEAM